jgi:hypothetical protein
VNCYRDMTFCSRGEGCTCPERRRLTPQVLADAERCGMLVASGVLCGTKPVAGGGEDEGKP